MLWALASSAFIIYLYRKLSAEEAGAGATAEVASPTGAEVSPLPLALKVELARLNERIRSLESRLSAD